MLGSELEFEIYHCWEIGGLEIWNLDQSVDQLALFDFSQSIGEF